MIKVGDHVKIKKHGHKYDNYIGIVEDIWHPPSIEFDVEYEVAIVDSSTSNIEVDTYMPDELSRLDNMFWEKKECTCGAVYGYIDTQHYDYCALGGRDVK